MSNYNTEKVKKYAALIVPFSGCSIGLPICQCPFKKYQQEKCFERHFEIISALPNSELDALLAFHKKCIQLKASLGNSSSWDDEHYRLIVSRALDYN